MTFFHFLLAAVKQVSDLGYVVAKRLRAEKWLTLARLFGLTATIAICISIPMYTDSVYYRVMLEQLSSRYDWEVEDTFRADEIRVPKARIRPPFAFYLRYTGQIHGAVEWEQVDGLDRYVRAEAARTIGLPQQLLVRHFRSSTFKLVSPTAADPARETAVTLLQFSFTDGLEEHIHLTQGKFPAVPQSPEEPVEIILSTTIANDLGIFVGDEFQTLPIINTKASPIRVKISGLWQPVNPNAEFWFYDPTSLAQLMLVPEETFVKWLSPQMRKEVSTAIWYLVVDGNKVHADRVEELQSRLSVLSRWENYLLPGSDMDPAVIDALNVYLAESQRMNFLLLGFSLPVIGFLILFIHMLSSLAVDGQRNEMTVMRSRGGSILTVLEMAGIEILFLAVASVLAGIPLSFLLVKGIGQIRSFLDFSSTNQIRIALTGSALVFGGVAVLICALTQLLPTISLAKKNVVSLRRERAEIATRPFWEWIGLDFLLLIATGYGYYLLRSQGGLGMGGESILNNPLLFLTPSLGICSLALLVLRIFPWLMKLVQWVSARTNLSVFYLAINTLTRSSRYYQAPMLLLVWSLSLSIFSASLAGVMERDLHDRSFYASGSELTILEIEKQENQSTNNAPGDSAGKTQGSWFSLPMSEYTRIPGVRAASRVAKYQAIAPFGEFSVSGKYIGLDRLDFPVVAFWRRDFADPSLGVLMNRLAAVPNGLIVSQQYLDQTYLQEGDLLSLKVNTSLDSRPMEFQIVGAVHFFPSWYPFVKEGDNNDSGKLQAEPVFIGNLEYLFEQIGAEGPYEIWLKTEPQVEFSDIVARIRHLGVPFEKWTAPRLIIEREQFAPERQGLFGVLSFGLLTSIILTCIGIVYFLLFSYRRRMFQLGILRALGLFPHQIVNILTLEIAITLGIAIGAGVASGYVFSKLFTPYLLVGDHIEAVTPPLIVTVAWESTLPILGVYLCLLTTSLVLLAFVIRRMKLPDTLKMGGNQ